MAEKVYHWKFLSSILSASKQIWSATTDNNQVIEFVDGAGASAVVNSLTIYANSDDLYVAFPPDYTFCSYIPAGQSKSFDFLRLTDFKILGDAPIAYRYEALAY